MSAKSITIIVFGAVLLLGGLITLIFMLIRTFKKKSNKEEKKDVPKIGKEVLDLIPIRIYDQDCGVYVLEDNRVMDIFKMVTKDLNNASSSEKNWDNMRYAKFYKMFADDIKIFALNYPCNTSQQQKYWKYKIENTSNRKLRELQEERLRQLEWLEKHNTSREFYLMIFGKDKDDYFKNKNSIYSLLGTGKDGLIENLSAEKKHQILYKLANKSAHIF